MNANESKISIERRAREDDLPELAVRILSDFARIVGAEARLLESNITGAANTLLDRIYIESILIVLAAAGVLAMLISMVLLMHHWMPWWQVLGIVGVCAIVVAEGLRRTQIPAPSASAVSVARPS